MSDAESKVLLERRDSILVITINRPQARNAIDLDVATRIAAAIDELDGRDELSVGIITGVGDVFCAGMDLKRFAAGERPVVPGRGFAGLTAKPPMKPLIAAVNGHALAGGFEIALACDMIVASTTAEFGLPEVRRGVVASAGALWRLPLRIPLQIATEMALTGKPIGAARAYEIGLLNAVTPKEDVITHAVELADLVSRSAPLAVAATKRVLVESPDWPSHEAFARQRVITEPVFRSADAKEGAIAFLEQRDPRWSRR